MAYENLNPTKQEALAVLDNAAANKFNKMITAFQKDPGSVEGDTLFAEFCGQFADDKINSIAFFLDNEMDKSDKDNYDKVEPFRDDKDLIKQFNKSLQIRFANATCEYFNSRANLLLNQLKNPELKEEDFNRLYEQHKKLFLVIANIAQGYTDTYVYEENNKIKFSIMIVNERDVLANEFFGTDNGLGKFFLKKSHLDVFFTNINDYFLSPLRRNFHSNFNYHTKLLDINKRLNEEFSLKKLEFALKSENQLSLECLIDLDKKLVDDPKQNKSKIINFMADKVGCLHNSAGTRNADWYRMAYFNNPTEDYLKNVRTTIKSEIEKRKTKIAGFIQQIANVIDKDAKLKDQIKRIAELYVGDILVGHNEREAKRERKNQIILKRKDLTILERATKGFIETQLKIGRGELRKDQGQLLE